MRYLVLLLHCTHKKNTGAPNTLKINEPHTHLLGGFLFFDVVVVVFSIIWNQLHCNQVADSPTDGGAILVLCVSDYCTKRVHRRKFTTGVGLCRQRNHPVVEKQSATVANYTIVLIAHMHHTHTLHTTHTHNHTHTLANAGSRQTTRSLTQDHTTVLVGWLVDECVEWGSLEGDARDLH